MYDINTQMAVALERIREGLRSKLERKIPDNLVSYDALKMWRIVAPERWPEPQAHTAYFLISPRRLALEVQPSDQIKALSRILSNSATADNFEGYFLGELTLHPHFNPENPSTKPRIGEPAFSLVVVRCPALQLPSGEPVSADGKVALVITEISDRTQFRSEQWVDVDRHRELVELRQGHFFKAHPEVRVYSFDGPQPYTAFDRKRPIQWDLVGFDNQTDSAVWVDRTSPEYFFDEGLKTILSEPNDRWQRIFAQQAIATLSKPLNDIPREKWVVMDKLTQEYQAK